MLKNDQIAELVKRFKKGDKKAYQELYDATHDGIYFTLLKRLGSDQDTQDILQETYVEAYTTIGNLKNNMAFVAWLNRIAYTFSMRYLNEKKKLSNETCLEDEQDFFDDDDDFIPESALDKKESRKLIAQVIDELPHQLKTAVLLYYYEELSAKEIAEVTGASESNVFTRLHRARSTIKERFLNLQQKGVSLFTMPAFTILNTVLKEEAVACVPQAAKAVLWSAIASEVTTSSAVGAASAHTILTPYLKATLVKLAATAAVGTTVATGIVVYNNKPVQPPQENLAVAAVESEVEPEEKLDIAIPEEINDVVESPPQIEPQTPIPTVSPIPAEPERFAMWEPPSTDSVDPQPIEEDGTHAEVNQRLPLQIPAPNILEEPPREYMTVQETPLPTGTAVQEPSASEPEQSQSGGASPGEREATAPMETHLSVEIAYQVNEGPSNDGVIEDIAVSSGSAFDPFRDQITVESNDFEINRIGDYTATVRAEKPDGKAVKVSAALTVIDTKAPKISIGNPYVTVSGGESPSPEEILEKAGVTVTDNSHEEITPEITGWERIAFHKTGEYVLYVNAVDSAGNHGEKKLIIVWIEPGFKAEN